MAPSLAVRFGDIFFRRFFPSLKEKAIHALLLAGALLYWIVKGALTEHLWENAVPFVWVFSGILAWHAVTTTVILWREQKTAVTERVSAILLLDSGTPARFQVPADFPFYRPKLIGIATGLCFIAAMLSYWAWEKTRPPESHLSPDELASMSDEQLKDSVETFIARLRSLYQDFDAEFRSTDVRGLHKEISEKEREAEHEHENKKFEKEFQSHYLENSDSIAREIINRLGKIRVFGPVSIPSGTKLGAVNLPARPPELGTGKLAGPNSLNSVANYLETLARMI